MLREASHEAAAAGDSEEESEGSQDAPGPAVDGAIRNPSIVSSGPFALKLHFHLELSQLRHVLFGGRDFAGPDRQSLIHIGRSSTVDSH
jgi:hypothetical protein